MSVRHFCEARQLNEKTYYHWQKEVRKAVCQDTHVVAVSPTTTFAAVSVSSAKPETNGSLLLHMGTITLEVTENTSQPLLKQTLSTLREVE
jgi:hypothetical protein